MSKIIPLFGLKPEAPEGLKMLLGLNRKEEGQLFRTAGQARRYFGVMSCSIPMSDYGGARMAEEVAEDIIALSHAEHRCAHTTERLIHALIIAMRNANEGEIYRFRLVDTLGNVIMGFADGKTFTLKVASDYQETLEDGNETFDRIHNMEFEINDGHAFLVGQSTES